MSVREHGPGRPGGRLRQRLPGPRDAGCDGRRARGARPCRWSTAATRRRPWPAAVEEVALALGVAELLDRRTDTLSGGELQRVAIAAALVHRPRLLLLDEPTSQLDPVAGDELIWMLRRLNEEWGTAVVLAEHRLERCLPAADRVVAIEDAAVAFDGAPADFLDWAAAAAPVLATPVARLFSLAGIGPLPTSVKEAREGLRAAGLATTGPGAEGADTARRGTRTRCSRHGMCGTRFTTARRSCAAGPSPPGRIPGGADGPQRRRQVHAAAPDEGAGRAHPRQASSARAGGAAAAEPGRLPDPRARRARRRARTRWAAPGWPAAATPTRATSRAASASGLRSRSCWAASRPRSCCLDEPTRGHGPRPQGRARRAGSPSSRRRAPRCWSPPTTPSSPRPSPSASC